MRSISKVALETASSPRGEIYNKTRMVSVSTEYTIYYFLVFILLLFDVAFEREHQFKLFFGGWKIGALQMMRSAKKHSWEGKGLNIQFSG